jgi:hypothetical protein
MLDATLFLCVPCLLYTHAHWLFASPICITQLGWGVLLSVIIGTICFNIFADSNRAEDATYC